MEHIALASTFDPGSNAWSGPAELVRSMQARLDGQPRLRMLRVLFPELGTAEMTELWGRSWPGARTHLAGIVRLSTLTPPAGMGRDHPRPETRRVGAAMATAAAVPRRRACLSSHGREHDTTGA